jgi:S-adenosylmethionine synthetase
MTNINITGIGKFLQESLPVEIVEKKGLGHPDTICNSIVDEISINYSKYCIEKFGRVLHHNFDKALLAAGATRPEFGGGEILEPITLVLGDRATKTYNGEIIPVDSMAVETFRHWMKTHIRNIKTDHLWYNTQLHDGSGALQDVFARDGKILPANDTSAGVGFAPFTLLEELTIDMEGLLNSQKTKNKYPFIGEDVKLMAIRNKKSLDLTVSIAMVDKYIDDEEDYFAKKSTLKTGMEDLIAQKYDLNANVTINALDQPGRGLDGLYLTVTGTSLEHGDSGQVGRGNNPYGIIPMMRPVSMEAAAGKNPVSHIGKIYNHLCFKIANEIHVTTGNPEVYVWMVSRIGTPINEPSMVNIHMCEPTEYEKSISKSIAEKELEDIELFCSSLIFSP